MLSGAPLKFLAFTICPLWHKLKLESLNNSFWIPNSCKRLRSCCTRNSFYCPALKLVRFDIMFMMVGPSCLHFFCSCFIDTLHLLWSWPMFDFHLCIFSTTPDWSNLHCFWFLFKAVSGCHLYNFFFHFCWALRCIGISVNSCINTTDKSDPIHRIRKDAQLSTHKITTKPDLSPPQCIHTVWVVGQTEHCALVNALQNGWREQNTVRIQCDLCHVQKSKEQTQLTLATMEKNVFSSKQLFFCFFFPSTIVAAFKCSLHATGKTKKKKAKDWTGDN